MLYICTKFCQSISKGFRVTDLNIRIDARVAANVDTRTNRRKIGSLYRVMPEAGATKGIFKSKQYFLYPCIKYEYLIELLDF